MHDKAIDYLKTALSFAIGVIVAAIFIQIFPDKNASMIVLPLQHGASSNKSQAAPEQGHDNHRFCWNE